MRRRTLLRAAPAFLAAPRLGSAQSNARTLRFAPQNGLTILDPVATTNSITRNHALMIYDTLFGLDRDMQPQPQMAAAHEVSADGLVHRIALRPELHFHDGERVTAADCIASIARWSRRDVLGQRLGQLLEDMRPTGDDRFEIALKSPWPGLTWALGKIGRAS